MRSSYWRTHDGSRLIFHDEEGLWENWNEQLYPLPVDADTFIGPISEDAGRIYLVDSIPEAGYTIERLDVDGTYARPKGATPVQVRLVPAYKQCTAPDRTHGPPLAFGSCSSPQPASDNLTVGTADSNARPTKSEGTVRFDALPGAPATPADEADLLLALSITDVRRRSDLDDYTGGVRAGVAIQATDRDNTPAVSGLNQGTSTQTLLSFDAACAATADATIGATCTATTSMDALVPGAIKEGKRSVWELGQVRVDDGGADGDPTTTADNTLFETQGVFVP